MRQCTCFKVQNSIVHGGIRTAAPQCHLRACRKNISRRKYRLRKTFRLGGHSRTAERSQVAFDLGWEVVILGSMWNAVGENGALNGNRSLQTATFDLGNRRPQIQGVGDQSQNAHRTNPPAEPVQSRTRTEPNPYRAEPCSPDPISAHRTPSRESRFRKPSETR
jgi:hypothetical protein